MPDDEWPPSCPAPGGGGQCYPVPEYAGDPFPSQHGIFYSWETTIDIPYRTLRVNADGTIDIRIEYPNGQGECYKPNMPVARNASDRETYTTRRLEYQSIIGRHLAKFDADWGNKPKPTGGIIPDGLGGKYFLPYIEGHDCNYLTLKDGLIRIYYASGNGWSNIRNPHEYKNKAEVSKDLIVRAEYCARKAEYRARGEAEWVDYLANNS